MKPHETEHFLYGKGHHHSDKVTDYRMGKGVVRRPLVHLPTAQTPEITTQKLYLLNHCLANYLSILLASSYI